MSRDHALSREKISINLARLRKGGLDFEIVIDPDKAISYKEGDDVELKEIVKSDDIFSDAKKGELSSETEMEEIFGTTDTRKIMENILKEGEIQISAEHRQRIREEKMKKLLNIIHRNAVDPKTHLPHPLTRLNNAFEEAKIKIDEHKKAEDQVQDVLRRLRSVLPIKFEIKEIQIHLTPTHAAKSYSAVKEFGDIIKDEWQDDGSWLAVVQIPGGMEQEFYDRLNSITHGEMETKIINTRS